MTTATSVPTAERIVAIDLGKYKSVACDYHPGSGEVAFTTLDTGRAELHRLFTRRRRHRGVCAVGLGPRPVRGAAARRPAPSRRADRLSTPADRAGELRLPCGGGTRRPERPVRGTERFRRRVGCHSTKSQTPLGGGAGSQSGTTRTVADDSAAGPRKAVGRRLDWRTLRHKIPPPTLGCLRDRRPS
jgi:hypothetical protein